MAIRISLYDFFAYTLPGGFYLLIGLYGLTIFGVVIIDLSMLNNLSPFTFIILIGLSYIVGLLLDPVSYKWSWFFQRRNKGAVESAFEEFQSRHNWLSLNFNFTDWGILLQVLRTKSVELTMNIEEHNVASIMLRNFSLGLLIGSLINILFMLIISANIWNLALAGACILLSIIAIRRSALRRRWFYLSIFEAVAAWQLPPDKWITDNRSISSGYHLDASQGIDDKTHVVTSETKSIEA